jgi:hypothetical protein
MHAYKLLSDILLNCSKYTNCDINLILNVLHLHCINMPLHIVHVLLIISTILHLSNLQTFFLLHLCKCLLIKRKA